MRMRSYSGSGMDDCCHIQKTQGSNSLNGGPAGAEAEGVSDA